MSSQDRTNRRDFLMGSAKTALALTAAAGLTAQAAEELKIVAGPKPKTFDADSTIRIGLVGTGGRGRALLNCSRKHPNIEYVAIADPAKENVDAALKMIKESKNQTPEVYLGEDDYRDKLLAREDIDVVFLATPCYLHARMYLDCFAAGKHFYGEKPLCIAVPEGDALVAAQKKNPEVKCQIGFQRRANQHYQDGIKAIQEGVCGDLFDGRGAWLNAWGPLGTPGTPSEWFGRRAKSGDWMLEQACHTWDVFNWMTGQIPATAHGVGRKNLFADFDPKRDVTDFYFATVEYPNGLVLDFEHSWVCPQKDEGRFSGVFERVAGKLGGVSLGLYPPEATLFYRDGSKEPKPLSNIEGKGNDTEQAVDAFFKSLRENAPSPCGVEQGRAATLAGLLVRKAVDEHRRVSMDEVLAMK